MTGGITTAQIANNTITAEDMATGSVTTDAILDGTIIGADLNPAIDIDTTGVVTAAAFSGDGTGISGVTATSADYATLAGSASSAAYSDLSAAASTAAYSDLSAAASTAAIADYSTLTGTASNVAGDINISTTGYITAETFSGTFIGSIANADYATLSGTATVATTATNNVLKAGDSMTGTLTIDAAGADLIVIQGRGAIGTTEFDLVNPQKLIVDSGDEATINVISGYGNVNSFLQLNIKNRNDGSDASSDLVATADNGDESDNYVDLGINSSTYNNGSYSIGGANDAYLYNMGQNLSIGTGTMDKVIKLHTGGTQAKNERMRIDGNGLVSIGTTDATSLLTVAGTIEMVSGSGGGIKFPNGTLLSSAIMGAANIGTDSVTVDSIATSNSPSAGNFLRYNGSVMDWATPGSITGSLEVDNSSIDININGSLEVMPGGIDASRIASGAVTADAIGSGAITDSKLAGDINITTTGYVTADSLTANYIYGNGAGLTGVSAETSSYSILAGTASSAAYATLAGSATTAASASYAGLSGTASTAATADYATLAGTASSAATVADGSITAAKFTTGAVTSGAIADNTITASDMGTGSVTSDAILNGTIADADLNSAINISTTGYITAESIKGGSVYIPSGKNQYLSNDSTSGSSAVTIPMIANGAINAGDVVIFDPTADNRVIVTTNTADQGVMGFATNTAANGQTVYVAVAGRVINAKTENIPNIVKGDYLETTGVNGAVRRVDKKLTVGATIGIALTDESASKVTVWIQKF